GGQRGADGPRRPRAQALQTLFPFGRGVLTVGRRGLRVAAGAYMALIFFFLYFPIGVLVVFSFNASRINATWQGFTLDWYRQLFHDFAIWAATSNSLIVGVASAAISTVIGTMAAFALHRYSFRGKAAFESLLQLPIVIPEIVMGVSLLAFFVLIEMPLGLHTVTIAHVAFNISFVTVVVRARLYAFDFTLEEAAMDLGANRWQSCVMETFRPPTQRRSPRY